MGAIILMAILHGLAADAVNGAVGAGQRIQVEFRGKILVSRQFLDTVRSIETRSQKFQIQFNAWKQPPYHSEAKDIARETGGSIEAIEQKLREEVNARGSRNLIARENVSRGLSAARWAPVSHMVGSWILIGWLLILVLHGEGLDLDTQRRRHPMWEWLFAHPVPTGAVFMAEMLSPLGANPVYWTAPFFVGGLYGLVYSWWYGLLAAFIIGVPVTVACACVGKSLEIGVMLRFGPRSRGAIIGLMGWIGFMSIPLIFFGRMFIPQVVAASGKFLGAIYALPWPWLRWFLGVSSGGAFSFLAGMLTCWFVSGVAIVGATWFSIWGSRRGLSGNIAPADTAPPDIATPRFGKDPLYYKEFLWFRRDRSAIIQVVLIPLSLAAVQAFNFRAIISHAQDAWNYLCGAAILFGTYFLWALGPKSLTSEGGALWISLTWPRGLESLLKAKAWLWAMVSTIIVALILACAAFMFPSSIWKIALVGMGWFIFSRSMAEKSVTLVSVPSASGEQEPIPKGRRWAAQLGMFTFSIGILTQQWQLAIVGIVYSYITAAAMWQNFRARVPFLYDPWSEKLPPPPTLMHAMVSISIMVEVSALLTGMLFLGGPEMVGTARAIAYSFSAGAVSIGVWLFLDERGVSSADVWNWKILPTEDSRAWWRSDDSGKIRFLELLFAGAMGGLLLGVFALGYLEVLKHIPASAEIIRKSQEQMAKIPGMNVAHAFVAIAIAPFAEEYLFRGLLYRALDREWGGWRAIAWSSAFFAIYHPPLSWLPVAVVGAVNALLFKRTGRLAPAVALHLMYNVVVSIYV